MFVFCSFFAVGSPGYLCYNTHMAYKDFINDFRKDILKDVLFFYGAEDYLMEWAVSQIISRYVDDEWRSIAVKYVDGSSSSDYDIMGVGRSCRILSD